METVERPFLGETTSTGFPPNYVSRALEAFAVAKTGDGGLVGFTVTNTNASAQFVLLFDASILPADGAVPIAGWSVPGAGTLNMGWNPYPRGFYAGLILCNSSTQASKTIGAADCLFDVQYL